MTKIAALENGDQNIHVNSVAPGAIDTPMLRGALEETGQTEEEFAQASLWLASDQSSYVTGTTIHVDAGYTSR